MKLLGLWLTLLGLIAIQSGCAICCAPDDPTYAAMGGLFERHDATRGRVGSAFSDIATRVEVMEEGAVDEGEDGNPTPAPPEAPPADEADGPPAPVIAQESDGMVPY